MPAQILLHVRTPIGTRIEESATQFADVQKAIRKIIPPDEIDTLVDNIGLPISGINLTYNNTGVIGSQDGDIQITLKEDHGRPPTMSARCASNCRARFPALTFSFLPADIVSQILNFGAPAPIDVQVRGAESRARISPMPTAAAPHPPHPRRRRCAHPAVAATIRASTSMSTAPARSMSASPRRDVTNSLVVNLAGSRQVAPTYWLNPNNGVSYPIVMQTPQYKIDSPGALETCRSPPAATATPQMLGGIANIKRVDSERGGDPLQHPADGADLCHDAGPRSGRGRGRHPDDDRGYRQADLPQGLAQWCCAARSRP